MGNLAMPVYITVHKTTSSSLRDDIYDWNQHRPSAKETMHTNLYKRLTLCQIAFSDPSINLCDNPPKKSHFY